MSESGSVPGHCDTAIRHDNYHGRTDRWWCREGSLAPPGWH